MASLRKQKRSNVWYAQFYVTDTLTGALRQVRKSTGQTNKAKAKGVAAEMERTARGAIESDSDKARLAKSILAEAVNELERETFTTLSARKHLARLLAIATGEEMTSYSIETWVAEWLRRKGRNSSKATMARYTGHTKAFLEWLGPVRSKKPLESLTPLDARKWRESLLDAGRTGKTVLAYTKDAGGVYRAAIREGLVSFNPFAALDAIDTSDSHERKPFTHDEFTALVKAAPSDEWRGLILLAAFTGLRLGDAARLLWSSVDMKAKRIVLIPSKTKRKKRVVRIPIQPDLLAFFKNALILNDKSDAPVFKELSTMNVGDRGGLSATFATIMKAAGVDRGKPSRVFEDGKERGVGKVTWEKGFHSLRHTFTTWLRTAGVSEEDRMALTGHSTRESHQIYSHVDDAVSIAAVAKLPRLTPDKP